MEPIFAVSVGAAVTLLVFFAGICTLAYFRGRRAFRDPDTIVGNPRVMSSDYQERQFKKPRDESDLL